ncbi:uncharacterized protein LOC119181698 isoform X5 [Rhipicephalus microplus]|uniref:uncharacterized protein LOC119181698 isoform X5 n=1 Tax=Rhipicephalus microplus TaxID=6941 RepID=UPI003F6CEDD4
MFNPGTFAMDDGGRCLLDVINDPLLLQSFLEDKNEEASNELSSFESALLGRDEVSSTTSCLPPRCELSESMGYSCSGTDKPVALAVSATTSSDVSASSSPQLLVSSSTVPPAAPPPATGASNGLPGASPHSTRSSPASSRPHSASPLPAPVPVSVSWSTTGPSAVPSRSQSLPSSSASTPATTKATATVAPLPVAPQQAPASRPGVAQVVSASPSSRTSGAPRLIQPKQPQILPKLSSGSANMTTPSAAATTRSQSPRAAQHKATPQPAPVQAPQPATTVQRGAAMGLNTGSPLLIGNPAAAQPGMFPAGPAQGTFLLNQYIPGLGHSPILIQGALGQIQSSLGQIQGVQLALRPPHATGLTLGPQTGPKPHGGHPGPPGTPTLVIPQNLGPRPNIFLAPPRMMSPPSFAIVPGQPLTLQQLQQLQAMLPTQTMLAQPTLGAFQTDQHQSLVQIPTFTQPQILAHDHHHHHHHHHHGALSGPLISTGGSIVSSAPSANIVTHHPVMTTTTVLHPAPPQHIPASVSAPMTSATIQQQPQAPTTTAPPAVEKPVKAPTVNLAELLKEHGIMPESTPPPSPTSSQENTISVEVPVAPAPVTESVQVVVSKSPQTVAVSPQQRVQLSLAHDGSVVLHPHGSSLSTMPAPAPSPGLVATTVPPTSTSAPGGTALSRTHSALLERLSAAPPVSVPDLASLTAPRVSVSAPTMVATPSLVAPSVVTPSMMGATPHPHQLTLHTVNNGLVQTQQLGQPQSFVTLHGTAVANMLCHGANNARINHIVVSPSPSLGQQQQQHHHHPHAVHHTCHAVVSSASSAVVPTTTTTAVMALSSQTAVGRTTVVPTSMAHTVVTVAACPTVTTVTVTPTVVVSTSNSSATAHGSGKCTASMNTQNQQLYEQLQSQITYLNSLKKPTMQQKLLLTQMLAIEEKLRDSSKPQRSAQGRNLALISAVPTSHAHCMQRHEVKPTVVSHPMPAAATIITAKPSAVTTVQVPTIAVATTTRTTSRTTHHKANHADVKPKASILHTGNAASIISTQKVITPHSVPNPASAKLAPLLHHSMHHHHHHQHHIHHHQPSLVGSSMPSVNQRSPPQPKCVRLQHPTNHIIAPPSTTKQILVQVPTIVNKPPTSKSSGSGNSSSAKSSAPVLPSKVEPTILPKTPLPPPEQPPAPPPPPPKPVVVKPKVPDRVQKIHAFHQRLMEDQNGAVTPDTKTPFRSRRDTCERLLRYHVYNSELPREEDLHKTDELFAEVSERLLGESRKLYQKFHYLMLKEGMRECSTAEKIMVDKFFIKHETDALIAEKQAAEEGQYSNIGPPTLPPMPESAWSFESSPAVHLPRPVKEEPPNSWLDDDDRSDLEPAPKRRSIKEEEPETVVVPAEIDPLPLPRVSVTPEHIDLVLGMRKELDMSPPETDEFARELADYEPPMAHFPSSAGLKQQFGNGGNIVPPVMVPDWTCGVKSAKPPSPELDLSGIDGLDDDSSGVGPLGRTHYFGDDDEEEDKDSVELHDQVQSAINSILDFRRAGADDSLGTDSKGAVARGGPEPMDYDDATGDAQPTDSVLDEAVRSILL